MKRLFVLFIGILTLSIAVHAQRLRGPDNYVTIKGTLGTHVFNNGGKWFNDYLFGADVTLSTDLSNRQEHWIKFLRAKRSGFEIAYRNLRALDGYADTAKNSFGELIGVLENISFLLFTNNNNFNLSLKTGAGIAVVTKTWFNDYQNIFMGSYLNTTLKGDLEAEFYNSRKYRTILSVGFFHVSNGGIIIPNKGLNLLNASLGFMYGMKPNKVAPCPEVNPIMEPIRHSFDLAFGAGVRGVPYSLNGALKGGAILTYNYHINPTLIIKFSGDAVYNSVLYNPTDEKTDQFFGSSYEHWRAGISTGIEFNLDPFCVGVSIGKYLYNKSPFDIQYYWSTQAKYFFNSRWGIHYTMYSHRYAADFFEIGPVFHLFTIRKQDTRFRNYE